MKLLYNHIFLEHDTDMHPENRKRLEAFSGLQSIDVIDGTPFLELVHKPSYIKMIRTAHESREWLDQDTRVSPKSFEAAVAAVGMTIMASDTGDLALVRPPGHHAYPDHASGFCLFNNIAVASQKLVNEGKRVLIFDFDGHLGDGTSHIFYDTDQVLYWSIHQYPAFPGNGFVNEIGEGKGTGYTINVPLPPGSGDDIFMDAVNSILPLAKQFQPDVVAVSAGFDAHLKDFLLQLRVTAESFYQIGIILKDNFPNIFAVLEGGYNTDVLPQCVHNFVAGINGKGMPFDEPPSTSSRTVWEEYELRLHLLLANLELYWKL